METKRIAFKNKFSAELQSARANLQRADTLLENCPPMTAENAESVQERKDKLQETHERLKRKVLELEERIELIKSGKMDDEISDTYVRDTAAFNKKSAKHVKTKDVVDAEKAEQQIIKDWSTQDYRAGRKEKYSEKDMQREESYFYHVIETLPDFIKRSIDNMPNNKGYKWRGIVFYGKKAPESNGAHVLFDKRPDGTYIIETTTTTETVQFKAKDSKDRPKLLSKRMLW